MWYQDTNKDGAFPTLSPSVSDPAPVLKIAAVGYSVHNLGETNVDGVVDENDYQNTVNLALSAQYLENADMYYDGTLDALDISAFEKAVFSGIVPEI